MCRRRDDDEGRARERENVERRRKKRKRHLFEDKGWSYRRGRYIYTATTSDPAIFTIHSIIHNRCCDVCSVPDVEITNNEHAAAHFPLPPTRGKDKRPRTQRGKHGGDETPLAHATVPFHTSSSSKPHFASLPSPRPLPLHPCHPRSRQSTSRFLSLSRSLGLVLSSLARYL